MTGTMFPVQLWIIEHRFRWLCSRGKMPERLIVLPEQGIDERDQASNHMAKSLSFSFVGLRSLVVGAKPRDKALVQAGPFRLGSDRTPCQQIHHLFHLSGATFREVCPIKGDSFLCSLGCPSEVGLEMTCIFKIGNMPNSRKNSCGTHRTDRGDREQNLPF